MRQHRSRHVERGVMDAGGGDARHQISSRSSSPRTPISTTSPPASRDRTRSSRFSRSSGGRSAATTTCRPASIIAFSVCENSAWVRLSLQELQIVDQQHVIPDQFAKAAIVKDVDKMPRCICWGVACLIASLRQAATKRKLTDRALDVKLKARHVCKQADISSSDRASAKPKVGQHDIKRLHEHADIL